MPRAAFSNFLLSATYPEIGFQVFRTNSTAISANCLDNPYTTVITSTAVSNGWVSSDKGSEAATLTFQARETNKNHGVFGFTNDPAPASLSQINYGWLLDDQGDAIIYENGTNIGSETYTTDTVFKISHRNNNIGYYKDNVLVRQVSGVNAYFYLGLVLGLYADSGFALTNINYDRYNFINVQTAPLTVTFQPSSINFEDQFVSKIVYVMPDRVVIRNFTFSTLQDALTGSTKDIDSRSNYSYTFYSSPTGGNINYYVTVSATLFPSLSTLQYVIDIPVNTPRLTRNPSLPSTDTFIFDSAHLLKSKAWGPDNTVLFVVEGVNHDNTSQLFLLSSTQ